MNGNTYNVVPIAMATEFPLDNNYRQNQGTTQPKLALLQYSLPLSIDPCSSGKSWQQQACCGQLQQCPAVCQGDFAYSLAWKKNKLCCNKSCLHKFYLHAEKPFKISGKDLIFKKNKK